jgi:hypothetical protein
MTKAMASRMEVTEKNENIRKKMKEIREERKNSSKSRSRSKSAKRKK